MVKTMYRFFFAFLFVGLSSSFVTASDVKIGTNKEILVEGKPFFPIMTWCNPSSLMDFNISLGINTFIGQGGQSEKPKDYLDACKSRNVLGGITFDGSPDKIEGEVLSLKDHPALLFWWMPDEPDIYGKTSDGTSKAPRLTPEEIKSLYDAVKKADATHPVPLNFGSEQAMGGGPIKSKYYPEYSKYADLIGFDIYPCNIGEPEKLYLFAKGLGILNKYDKGQKPHFVWVDCSFFGAEGGVTPKPKARAPNAAELKAQVWMCIVNGAKMIGYFGHSWSPYYNWARIPKDLQEEIKKINRNITALSGVILAKDSEKKVTVEDAEKTQVDTLVKEADGKLYIFTSNRKNGEGKVSFTVPVSKGIVEVYDEGRKIEVNGGKFVDNFMSFEPHIYVVQ